MLMGIAPLLIITGLSFVLMKIKGKTAIASALFIGAIFVIGIKLLSPITISIIVGDNGTVIKPDILLFTIIDVLIITISALILGISGAY